MAYQVFANLRLLNFLVTASMLGCAGTTLNPAPLHAKADTTSLALREPAAATSTNVPTRTNFVGAFFRPIGSPPYGIFATNASQIAPVPYPTPGSNYLGSSGYCERIAPNGHSIDASFPVDSTKLANIVDLGVRWTRMTAPQFTIDMSHVFGTGSYAFAPLDSAECYTLVKHSIVPVIGLEAGPVQYDSKAGTFSPHTVGMYKTATDFGEWCGAVAAHQRSVFPTASRFSLPGNEINSNPEEFPGGRSQIASYSEACYAAIKSANPSAFVYGFELNMDGSLNAPGFVRSMASLGCKVGTCYDGIAIHLSLRYPIPSASTPCYPQTGGDYGMQCVSAIQAAAGSPIHVLISESVYPFPAGVPNAQIQSAAVVAEYSYLATNSTIDGVSYSDVDECALYTSGYFVNGCLVTTSNKRQPAYGALESLANAHFL